MMTTLGELLSGNNGLIQTGPFGSQLKQKEYSEEGIPVVMPTNINEGKVATDGIAYITEEKAQALNRHKVKIDSILLPRRGEISKRAFITEKESGWICGTGCIKIEINRSDVVPKYLYYLMGTVDSVSWLTNNAVGTTMLNLSASILQRFPVSLPSIETQRKTVSVLSNYDDLIENNRRRIALLEESARLLYREITYQKVVGKTNLMPLIEFSALISRGITPKYSDDGDSIVINQKCIREKKVNLGFARRQVKSIPEQKLLKKYDVLVNSTGAGTLGRVAQNFHSIELLTVDSHVTICRPGLEIPPLWYGVMLTEKQLLIETLGRGSTNQTELSRDDLGAVVIEVPTHKTMSNFDTKVEPIFDQIFCLSQQNIKLINARDLLLPRLMDGRIDV